MLTRNRKIRIIESPDEVILHIYTLSEHLVATIPHFNSVKEIFPNLNGVEDLINSRYVWCYDDTSRDSEKNPRVLLCIGKCIMDVPIADIFFGCLADAIPVSKALYKHLCLSGVNPVKVDGIIFDKLTFLLMVQSPNFTRKMIE